MRPASRKLAFVLAASAHGTMILSRLDYNSRSSGYTYGVGHQILDTSSFDPDEVAMVLRLLKARRQHHGDGVVALDCGANIGVHTIEWAIAMTGWGSVTAIEAQERVYYALAGNIAINNCFNAVALHAAISSEEGVLRIPKPDYLEAASLGSLELRKTANTEFIGQTIDYSDEGTVEVRKITLDSLKLPRLDLVKIDIEGMEMEALKGGAAMIETHRPIIVVEALKTGFEALEPWFRARNYKLRRVGINLIAVHESDKVAGLMPAQLWS